jgi:predicted ATP-binding protein involved in virulence
VVLLGYGPRRFFSNTKGHRRKDGTAARLQTLFDPTAIITNPTGWLMNCSDQDYNAAIRALRQLLQQQDASFVARPLRGQRKGAEIMFELQGSSTSLKRLSEGYRTVVATAVDIMREMLHFWPNLENARGVVLIDELETHLHPRWKMRILQRLRTAMPGVQFIATTHDPLCLRGLYDGEVQVLRRVEGSKIEQLTDLPNVQGLTVEQLLTSEFFGLLSTEDPKVEEELVRYVALATKVGRSTDEEAELQQHRDRAQRRMRLGATPQAQMIYETLYETVNEFLVKQRQLPSEQRPALKRDTAEKMQRIWSSLRDDPTPS